jgi:hypothetical protein
MTSHRLAALFLGTAAAFSFAAPASADVHTLYAQLTGSQEVPPVSTSGQGMCTITLDDVTGAVSVSGSFSGLTTSATMAHIHGLGAPGTTAGIIVTLTETGGTSGTVSGSGTLTGAEVTGMLAGLTYVNVHSSMHGGGEIRGQITPGVPSMPWKYAAVLAVLALAGGAFVLVRRPVQPAV